MNFIFSQITYMGRFIRFMFVRFIEDRGTHTAGTLAYTSLISLVPLLAVGLSFLAIFSDFKDQSGEILDFFFANFVPSSKETLQEYVVLFADKASRLSAAGLIVLMVTALLMMATIDSSLNRIWRVRTKRTVRNSIMVYWLVLTLGPLLVGVGIGLTSYLVSLPLVDEAATSFGGKQKLLEFIPYILETGAFVLLYLVVPNRRIRFRHALAGGILAALLFESAKAGFAWYVTHFPTYEAIYGALAVIPIFLVWVYVSWVVILLGAEFACCLDVYRDKQEMKWESQEVKFLLAVRLIGYMWLAQQHGKPMMIKHMLKQMPTVDEESLRDVLLILEKADFIARTDRRRYILTRDLDEVSLLDLYRSADFALPEPGGKWQELDGWSQRLGEALVDIERKIEDDMAMSLKSFYRTVEDLDELNNDARKIEVLIKEDDVTDLPELRGMQSMENR